MKKTQTNLEWWQIYFSQHDFEGTEWALDAEFDVDLDDIDTDYFSFKTAQEVLCIDYLDLLAFYTFYYQHFPLWE